MRNNGFWWCNNNHRKTALFILVLGLILLICFDLYISYSNDSLNHGSSRTEQAEEFEIKPVVTVNQNFLVKRNVIIAPKKCEVIHIGFVCVGSKSYTFLHTTLKSILFYRTNPIHLHIVSTHLSENVLRTLFETWQLPKVIITYYNVTDYLMDVRWVPNSHYSGIYGLLKLVFPKIVSLELTKRLIVLDTDLIFTADILELWNLFKNFNKNHGIGMVDNQSEFYLSKNGQSTSWPALGRGFNSGVLLFDLERLHHVNWMNLWSTLTKKTALIYGATQLGDQDILNAIIVHHPLLLYKVPCNWNVQLGDNAQSKPCYTQYTVKISHWNSPGKIHSKSKLNPFFTSLYYSIIQLNGNLLRDFVYQCNNDSSTYQQKPMDQCDGFRRIHKWRTLLYFREYEYLSDNHDVTLVAHLSFDRLQMLDELARYWVGPISIAIYLTDAELHETVHFIDDSFVLQDRNNIGYHAVFKDGIYYPINVLRNVALNNVITPYVFLSDIDFIPMPMLYSTLKRYITQMAPLRKKALILPAFETQQYRFLMPKSKSKLLHLLDGRLMSPFRYDVWSVGHAPTNYTKWRTASEPYEVKWHPDFEPYVVVRSDVTAYDNRFMGFGWNKVSHIMKLEAQGYSFIVLPDAFIVHKPHAPSHDIGKFRTSSMYRMCLQSLKEEFVQMLTTKYNRTFENINRISILGEFQNTK